MTFKYLFASVSRMYFNSSITLLSLLFSQYKFYTVYAQVPEYEHSHVEEKTKVDLAKKRKFSRLFDLDQEILRITQQQQQTQAKLTDFQELKTRYLLEIKQLSKQIKNNRLTLLKLLSIRKQIKSTRIVELLLSADGPLDQKRREVYIQAVFNTGSQRFKALLSARRDLAQRQKAIDILDQKESRLKTLLDQQAEELTSKRRQEWLEIDQSKQSQAQRAKTNQVSEAWVNKTRLPPVQGQWLDEFRKFRGLSLAKMFGGGIWILAPKGSPIYSVEAGAIIFAGPVKGWGEVLIIEHQHNYITVYANLSDLKVKAGQKVRMQERVSVLNDIAGREGLYFELRRGGEPIHPERWLSTKLMTNQ